MTTVLIYDDSDFLVGNGVEKYLLSQQIENISGFPANAIVSISAIDQQYIIHFNQDITSFITAIDAIVATHDPLTQFNNEPNVEAVYVSKYDTYPKFLLSSTGATGALSNFGNIHFDYVQPDVEGNYEQVRADIGVPGNTGDILILNPDGTWGATGPTLEILTNVSTSGATCGTSLVYDCNDSTWKPIGLSYFGSIYSTPVGEPFASTFSIVALNKNFSVSNYVPIGNSAIITNILFGVVKGNTTVIIGGVPRRTDYLQVTSKGFYYIEYNVSLQVTSTTAVLLAFHITDTMGSVTQLNNGITSVTLSNNQNSLATGSTYVDLDVGDYIDLRVKGNNGSGGTFNVDIFTYNLLIQKIYETP